MLTSVRSLLAATILAGSVFAAAPAMAEDEPTPAITVTGNVSLVTDYRFRGVGLSNGNIAIQGGFTVSHESGFYVGTWGSSLGTGDRSVDLDDGTLAGNVDPYDVGSFGVTEVDVWAGWTGSVADNLAVDAGIYYYYYPDATNHTATYSGTGVSGYPVFDGYAPYKTDVLEFYAKVKPTIGPVGLTLGVAYAPDQDSLGGGDNLYLSADASVGIPSTPISLSAHAGYTDGFLVYTSNGKAWDYSVGASVTVLGGLTLGVAYVGVEQDGPAVDGVTDDTVVGTLGFTF